MAGKLALVRGCLGSRNKHSQNVASRRRGAGIMSNAVVANLETRSRACDQPFDVKTGPAHHRVAGCPGLKDDNLATVGLVEIAGEPVHEQMVARTYAEFHQFLVLLTQLAFPEFRVCPQACAHLQGLARRSPAEPDGLGPGRNPRWFAIG